MEKPFGTTVFGEWPCAKSISNGVTTESLEKSYSSLPVVSVGTGDFAELQNFLRP